MRILLTRWPYWLAAVLVAALAVGLVGVGPQRGQAAQVAAELRTINAVGQATLDVHPDRAVVTLGVEVTEKTAADSYRKASEVMNQIVSNLTLVGVLPPDVQTANLSLFEQRNYNPKTGEQTLEGYRTTSQLRVTVRDLDKIGQIVDTALAAGANSLQGINFTVKDTSQYVDEALDKAVDDAKANATRVAKRLGAELGPVYKITISKGQSGPQPPVLYAKAAAEARDAGMPVMPGTVPFQAMVDVTFELR